MKALTDVGIALRAAVELRDLRDLEPPNELLPDLGSEAVAEHEPDLVLSLLGALRGVQEVSANFADVLSSLDIEN